MRKNMKIKEIETLIELCNRYNLSALEYQEKELSIKVKREMATPLTPPETKVNAVTVEEIEAGSIISSPIVGTFYRTPSPDSPPYVEVGSKVHKGDVLCTIEAMKIMNQLEADFDCEIIEIFPPQASLVEFNQKLFKVKPL
jgi:acetyl-CoA carboxylase biotin carboxyl carrier protein